MLRVLMACDLGDCPYVRALCQPLRDIGVSVDSGLDRFWLNSEGYDIVHLQWPEALFRWKEPDWLQVRTLLRDVMPAWRRSSRVVITRHNEVSHGRSSSYWRYMYEHIYHFVDGVVHLGETGVERFKARWGDAIRSHAIIPLPVYGEYGDPLHRQTARRMLRIPHRKNVILAFGSVRHDRERRLLQDAFSMAKIPGKVLLAPTFGTPLRPPRRDVFRWILWEAKHHEVIWPRRMRLGKRFAPEEQKSRYFAASDVVVIPRVDTLNSAMVPEAFHFAKVVAGPNIGNIGPILLATGNPTFDPASASSCAAAIEQASALASEGLGARNAQYAEQHWGRDRVALLHKDFYENVLGLKDGA